MMGDTTDDRLREIAEAALRALCQQEPTYVFEPEAIDRVKQAIGTKFPDLLRSAREEGIWQPIETAPKDGTRIDLYYPSRGRVVDSFWSDDNEWTQQTPFETLLWRVIMDEQPSHWMPLPSPPSESLKGLPSKGENGNG